MPEPLPRLPVPHCTWCGHYPHDEDACVATAEVRRWRERPGVAVDEVVPCPCDRRDT